jgi:alcohol dehydrogenase
MKAVRLDAPGAALRVDHVTAPPLRSGGVLIDVLAAPVLSYFREVASGERGYLMPTPFTPGSNAIGRVVETADDVEGLEVGGLVFAGSLVRPQSPAGRQESILLGLTADGTPIGGRLQQRWRDGSYAEQAVYPVDSVTPLEGLDAWTPATLAYLTFLSVAYGGLAAGDLRPGDSVIIIGGTGHFGAAAVATALALGAARVVPAGRDQPTLELLRSLDPVRVEPVLLTGDVGDDAARLSTASGKADLVLDLLTAGAPAEPTLAGIRSARIGGQVVLMGGATTDLAIPYGELMRRQITLRGAFMYPSDGPRRLVALIRSGQLALDHVRPHAYPLERVAEAVDVAAATRAPDYIVLQPDRLVTTP